MTLTDAELTACDTEEVHLVGRIQPIGGLIVADAETRQISRISSNISDVFQMDASEILGAPLSRFLAESDLADIMEEVIHQPNGRLIRPGKVRLRPKSGKEILLRHLTYVFDTYLFIEVFFDMPPHHSDQKRFGLRQDVVDELRACDSIDEFSRQAVRLLRKQTGYDRVMCYRFHPDGHGEVIAEDTDEPNTFIGLHYPASDIPEPARRQFRLNRVRIIADVDAETVPIIGADGDDDSIDLSHSKLRAVSPVHLQYLRNMGVAATLTLPLTVEGELWGLLVCHHLQPRELSPVELYATELTAQVVELLFENIIRQDRDKWLITAQQWAFGLSQPDQLSTDLADVAAHLGAWFRADAAAARIDETWLPLWQWEGGPVDLSGLHAKATEGLFTTDDLGASVDIPQDLADTLAGCAFISIDQERNEFLVLTRKEFREEVAWAGAPAKPVGHDDEGRPILEPRASFSRWQNLSRGKSRSFSPNEEIALAVVAQSLRAFVASRRARELEDAKRELEKTQSELRAQLLTTARSASLGELAAAIAHELNQPLTSISNFVSAIRILMNSTNTNDSERVSDLMDQAVSEAQRAGDIIHHLRNLMRPGFERKSDFDPKEMLEQSVRLALSSSSSGAAKLSLSIDEDLPTIYGDKVQLEQLVFNLVRNAVEAMEGQSNRHLSVRAARNPGGGMKVVVEDTGPGIAMDQLETLFQPFQSSKPEGMGIGLSLCRSTVEAHSGHIWGENTDRGASFGFVIPSEREEIRNGA